MCHFWVGAGVVQLAQSCQADMHRHKAMAINELRDLLPADLLVCTVLLSQSVLTKNFHCHGSRHIHTQMHNRKVKKYGWGSTDREHADRQKKVCLRGSYCSLFQEEKVLILFKTLWLHCTKYAKLKPPADHAQISPL